MQKVPRSKKLLVLETGINKLRINSATTWLFVLAESVESKAGIHSLITATVSISPTIVHTEFTRFFDATSKILFPAILFRHVFLVCQVSQ